MKKVSVIVLTYNLEAYIRECLESIISQKVNFDYEIIIADDFSKDGTRDILKEYKNRYPELITLILAEKNGGTLTNNNRAFEMAKGEYFTLIDGDDYWIDENRLQEQVDFLDTHQEFTMCSGNSIFLRDGKRYEKVIAKKYLNREYTFNDLCNFEMPYIHTSAMLTRNVIYKVGLPKEFYDVIGTPEECAIRGDYIRILQHLALGKVMVCDKDYSVYRVHSQGIWQGGSSLKSTLESTISFQYFRKNISDNGTCFFEKCLVESYRELTEEMSNLDKFRKGYQISDKESRLLLALLADLKENPPSWDKYPMKKKENKYFGIIKKYIKGILHR